MLPSQPMDINPDPWWIVDVGCLFEDDIKVYYNLNHCRSINNFILVNS